MEHSLLYWCLFLCIVSVCCKGEGEGEDLQWSEVIRLVGDGLGYSITANFSGNSFFDNFDFFTASDPTHGYVNYVDRTTAQNQGLIGVYNGQVYIGCDHTNVANWPGRNSVRLSSSRAFNNGLFIIDLLHMPTGCGTWPAFWLVGPDWPNNGEIDIIEGVDEQSNVLTTLHTSDGCDESSVDQSQFTGKWNTGTSGNQATNCYVNAPNQYANQGCSIVGASQSMGDPFNNNQGGVYATEWVPNQYIRMWFWPRNQIPYDVRMGQPNPGSWGLPYALFNLGSNCPTSHFNQNQIIFDLTFCGDWDGSVFGQDCPGRGDCNSYVQNNPQAFNDAYWLVNYVAVYQ